MKFIKKNPAPMELIQYSQTPRASYKGLREKENKKIYALTKLSLTIEQGYVCCYCGQRISGIGEKTQIEHILPKGIPLYQNRQLDYENLLACCDGGKGDRVTDKTVPADTILHCDASKNNEIIPIHPLMPDCEERFIYDDKGDVFGTDSDAEKTIEILNLPSPVLVNMRKAAIDNYSLKPPSDWKEEYERLDKKDSNGFYPEFCFVLRSYIYFFHGESLTP